MLERNPVVQAIIESKTFWVLHSLIASIPEDSLLITNLH